MSQKQKVNQERQIQNDVTEEDSRFKAIDHTRENMEGNKSKGRQQIQGVRQEAKYKIEKLSQNKGRL